LNSLIRKALIGASKLLIANGDPAAPIGRRYLQIMARRQKLRDIVKEIRERDRQQSVLSTVGFKPPLSVAGCCSDTIVRAEGLALRKIPVAFELDAKARHRGTSIDELAQALEVETGGEWTERAILEEYAKFMQTYGRALSEHSDRRFARIPRYFKISRSERDALESRLMLLLGDKDPRIFSVAVRRNDLMAAVHDKSGPVVLGCRERLKVGHEPVITSWVYGGGMCVVAAEDLISFCSQVPEDSIVTITAELSGWNCMAAPPEIAITELLLKVDEQEPTRFQYFTEGIGNEA
jgi:hypothetical protein